jgi:hypothetical protein
MAGLLLAGDLYLDRLNDNGTSTGYLGPLNGTKLGITNPDPDQKERISKMRDSLGQALDVVNIPKPAELTIGIDDQPTEVLAMALLGSIESVNHGAGSVVDAAVTLIPGRWTKLDHSNIIAAGFSVATVADPGTPLVLGTDYDVNYADGMIMAKAGGALSAQTACLVDYDYAAVTGKTIQGGARPTARCRVMLLGKNLVTGASARLEIDEAVLSPSGEVDLLSGEFITTELTGKMRTLPGATSPYRYTETS